MRLKEKIIINILLVFSMLQLYGGKYIVQGQNNTEDQDILKTAPVFVVVTPYIQNTLNVTWDVPDKHNLAENASFNIKYWKRDNETSKPLIKQYVLDPYVPSRLWTLLMRLETNTFYFVQVVQIINGIEGPESETVLARTYRKAPMRSPTSVKLSSIDNTTLKVTWHPVEISIDEEPIEGYKIRVWEDSYVTTVVRDIIVPGDVKLEGYINNLESGKIYDMRVLAFSKAGDGKMSSPTYTFSLKP